MQLINSVILLASLFATANAAALEESPEAALALKMRDLEGMEAPSELVDRGLEKRACRKNGCACRKGTKQGQYCGLCYAVTDHGSGSSWYDIFECNSSGGCCSYGTSSHCNGNSWNTWCPK